jgi:hypothetical protein
MKFQKFLSKQAFFIALLLLFTIKTNSQEATQRFKAGIVAGLTTSQIDGDASAGYNKIGVQAGLRGIIVLKEKTESSIELLFSQRGAASALVKNPDDFRFLITLNYVEIPVQFHYKDWLIEDKENGDYYKVSFNAGLSFARLLGTKVSDDLSAVTRVVPALLEKNDYSFMVGANIWANQHFGFTVRYVRSIGFMYNPKKWSQPPFPQAWNGHTLNFQSVYLF